MALVGGLVQQRFVSVGVPGQKHRCGADPHRRRIDLWHALLVERHSQGFKPQTIHVRLPAYRRDDFVDGDATAIPPYLDPATRFSEFNLSIEMDGKFLFQIILYDGRDLLVRKPRDPLGTIETVDLKPEPRQRLRHFHPERTKPDHSNPVRKIFLVEKRIRRQDPVAEGTPGLWHDRTRSGRQHDLTCLEDALANNQPVWTFELRFSCDVTRTELLGRL